MPIFIYVSHVITIRGWQLIRKNTQYVLQAYSSSCNQFIADNAHVVDTISAKIQSTGHNKHVMFSTKEVLSTMEMGRSILQYQGRLVHI